MGKAIKEINENHEEEKKQNTKTVNYVSKQQKGKGNCLSTESGVGRKLKKSMKIMKRKRSRIQKL